MGISELLYKDINRNAFKRMLIRPLVSGPVSELSGLILDSSFSKLLIDPFIKANKIKKQDFILDDINSFNDFFCRKIKPGLRPTDMSAKSLVAPCDGLLSAYRISGGTVLGVKGSSYKIDRLLRDRKLAATYEGGYALVYRLCVNHYHRYMWFDSGKKYLDRRIEGVYHTVRPVALAELPVYVENTREYSVIDTKNFGRCVQMEVGAMLVGRIVNNNPFPAMVKRGREKGHFEYGGSTVIVLVPKGKAGLRKDIKEALDTGKEIPVVMGEVIGTKKYAKKKK